jgi:hypothetical protein
MTSDSYDTLRRALIQALGPRPSPEQRRKIAADLRSLAEQQERMAERDAQVSPSATQPGASRVAGMYIRLNLEPDTQTGAPRIRLSLGKQIWYDLGSPEHIQVQQVGAETWIVAAKDGAGYQLSTAGSLPSCLVDIAGSLSHMRPGRYAASVRAGALVIGERVG